MARKISDQSWQEMKDIGDYWDQIDFLLRKEEDRRFEILKKIVYLMRDMKAENEKKASKNHYLLEIKYRELSELDFQLADRYLYFEEKSLEEARKNYLDGAKAAFEAPAAHSTSIAK